VHLLARSSQSSSKTVCHCTAKRITVDCHHGVFVLMLPLLVSSALNNVLTLFRLHSCCVHDVTERSSDQFQPSDEQVLPC
jgi:hypothetical protein